MMARAAFRTGRVKVFNAGLPLDIRGDVFGDIISFGFNPNLDSAFCLPRTAPISIVSNKELIHTINDFILNFTKCSVVDVLKNPPECGTGG